MSGHAFKLCPALGLGAAELLLDGEVSSFDWAPFRYGRFDRRPAASARGAGGTGTG
jgi:glycine/D-amino acid oxidase-like deaminating enzyme